MASFHVDVACNPYEVVAIGWAAPADGRQPCALQLVAGGEVVAVVKATRFSAEAAQRGQRLGWCGFRIGDLSIAAALDDDVRLVCAATGKEQVSWKAEEVVQRAAFVPPPRQTLPEYRNLLQMESGCRDVTTILPFARRLQRMEGDLALVIAAYRWILHRTPSTDEAEQFLRSLPAGDLVRASIEALFGSEERSARPFVPAGPFSSGFPFDLGALEEA